MAGQTALPTDEQLQLFRGLTEDAWLRATRLRIVSKSFRACRTSTSNVGSPGRPATRQLVEAHALARAFKDLYRDMSGPFDRVHAVLDYGCGWGRIIRFFLKDVVEGNLWGIDCNEDLIDFCRESNPWARFELNDPLPPTDLAADHFDLAFSYSVFTHLREDVHLAWLDELRRVVKPGGLLILTVRPRHFISYCAQLTAESDPAAALVDLFSDPEQALDDYDRGRFVYVPYPVSGYGEWWGEACISRAYVERAWPSRAFELLEFVEDPSRFKQNLVVLRASG